MPSPNPNPLFVRKTPLSHDEWLELIEKRRALIDRHLDVFTLPCLGDHEFMISEGNFTHSLKSDLPNENGNSPGFDLNLQGIFQLQHWKHEELEHGTGYLPHPESGFSPRPNGTKYAWGLTRTNVWVLVTIKFLGVPGYRERGDQKASHVHIDRLPLPAIIEKTRVKPERIWQKLGNVAKDWEGRCLARLAPVQAIVQIFAQEEATLALIPKS